MDKALIEEAKLKLQKEKEEVIEELSTVANKDKGEHVPGDFNPAFPDYGDDKYDEPLDSSPQEVADYEVNLDVTSNLEARLLEIEGALDRIDKGDYGTCEKCGKEIPADRLKANPAALTCVNCG